MPACRSAGMCHGRSAGRQRGACTALARRLGSCRQSRPEATSRPPMPTRARVRSFFLTYFSPSACSCPVPYLDQVGVAVLRAGPRHTISAGGSARKTRTGLGFRSAICCAHTVPASSCPEGQACPKGRSSDWERKLAADAAPGSGRFAREASVHRNHAAPRLQFYRPCRVLRTPRHTAGWRLHRHSERSRYSKRASRTRGTEISRGLAPGEFPVRRYASRYAADARLVFCAGQESSCLRNRQSGCLTLDAGRRLGPRITSCSQPLSKKLTHYFWGPTKNCRSPACG